MPQLALRILRRLAVDAAWDEAVQTYPALRALSDHRNAVRDAMESAVDKALADGVTDVEELTEAALQCLPNSIPPHRT